MPQKPTWQRYKNFFLRKSDISIYRALEYEALSKVQFSGRILDFGGGARSHYLSALKSWMRDGVYESANISADMEPTYLIVPGADLPVATGTFDMVLSMNTLEHVYDLEGTLRELIRVLKPGGRVVLAVPFLFRVHGCPDDYNRPTASWWQKTLPRFGMHEMTITPLVWDVLTTGLSVTEGAGPFSKLRRVVVPLYGLLYALVRARGSGERYPRPIGESLANVALGYVITGVKHS
ncbi:MAG: class I SAM-dependent methyltransferase [Nitrospiraceae bacterium]|nr:class I SAM-dependent methyltransferase [Nitrospiraceae bacterium]